MSPTYKHPGTMVSRANNCGLLLLLLLRLLCLWSSLADSARNDTKFFPESLLNSQWLLIARSSQSMHNEAIRKPQRLFLG